MNILRAVLLMSGFILVVPAPAGQPKDEQRAAIIAKLKSIRVPRVQFNNVTIGEAVEYFQMKSRELDPTKRGVNIIAKIPEGADKVAFSLDLTDVPLDVALGYAVRMTNLSMRVEPHAVVIASITEGNGQMYTRTYTVPPYFLQAINSAK